MFLSSYLSLFEILFTPVLVLNTCRSNRNTIASRPKGTTSPNMGLSLLTTCLGGEACYFVENRSGWPWELGVCTSQLSPTRDACTRIALVLDTVAEVWRRGAQGLDSVLSRLFETIDLHPNSQFTFSIMPFKVLCTEFYFFGA
jgi:hypothetical protein